VAVKKVDKDGDGFDPRASVPITVRDPNDNDPNIKPAAQSEGGLGADYQGQYGQSEPYASVASPAEAKADFTSSFTVMFGANPPKELLNAYTSELRSLQASRTNARVKGKSGDIVVQGVSAQERQDILNKYLKVHANTISTLAKQGDPKAVEALKRGSYGSTITKLKNAYAENGLPLNENSIISMATESTLDPKKFEANLNLVNLQAKTYFPALADKIDKGYTVKQLLSPYIQTRANILEEDPDMVDIKSLQSVAKDPKNLMNLYDYEVSLRQDPKWRFTKNAQDNLGSLANSIAKMFGLVG